MSESRATISLGSFTWCWSHDEANTGDATYTTDGRQAHGSEGLVVVADQAGALGAGELAVSML